MGPDIIWQITKFVVLFSSCEIAILFIGGVTNRVIVFEDRADFAWTAGIPVGMTIAWLAWVGTQPEQGDLSLTNTDAFGVFVRVAVFLGIAFAMGKVCNNSIKANGWPIGLIMFVFKIVASIILIILAFGLLNQYFPDDKKKVGRGPSMSKIIFYSMLGSLLGWLIVRLINGNAVRERRFLKSSSPDVAEIQARIAKLPKDIRGVLEQQGLMEFEIREEDGHIRKLTPLEAVEMAERRRRCWKMTSI